MSLKKKLGSKLANGVRQVKLQREQTPVAPAKTVATVKATVKSAPTVATNQPTQPRPVATRPASKTEVTRKTEVNNLHPQRIWPD